MRPSKTVAVAALLLSLAFTFAPAGRALAACGSSESDPCLEEYNARFCAEDCYRDEESHPFRVFAYILNPIGVGLEWLIFRPMHWVVSRPSTAPIFGHTCDYDY